MLGGAYVLTVAGSLPLCAETATTLAALRTPDCGLVGCCGALAQLVLACYGRMLQETYLGLFMHVAWWRARACRAPSLPLCLSASRALSLSLS